MQEPTARLKHPTAHLLLPCRSDAVPTVRALLARDLKRWAIAEDVWGKREAVMVIRWALSDGLLFTFQVQDRGPGFDNSRAAISRRAHPSQNRGRGLYIMHALMDRVVVDSSLTGTRILLEKLLDTPAAG